MPNEIKSRPGLLAAYGKCSDEVKAHFGHLEKLVVDFPLDVALAYVFARLELAQNMALYCGVVKVHRGDSELTRRAISIHHLTRENFVLLYEEVFDLKLPTHAKADLETAEEVRDAVMHGKPPSEEKMRNAVARVLEYADAVNKQLRQKHGIIPFGSDLRGFTGRAEKHDKRTTRFLLKGMGFTIA